MYPMGTTVALYGATKSKTTHGSEPLPIQRDSELNSMRNTEHPTAPQSIALPCVGTLPLDNSYYACATSVRLVTQKGCMSNLKSDPHFRGESKCTFHGL